VAANVVPPAGGANSAPLNPLAGFEGLLRGKKSGGAKEQKKVIK